MDEAQLQLITHRFRLFAASRLLDHYQSGRGLTNGLRHCHWLVSGNAAGDQMGRLPAQSELLEMLLADGIALDVEQFQAVYAP